MSLKILLGVVTNILGKHLNLDIKSAITKCNNLSIMYFYYLSPNTKASQNVDYALNTGLVLFFLELTMLLFVERKLCFKLEYLEIVFTHQF